MNELTQNLRYAFRQLRKTPGFTVVAVLTLALGIGANTAIFSVIEAAMLRPLPYKDPTRLVLLADSNDAEDGGFLLKDIGTLRSESHSFSDVAFYYRDSGFSTVTLSAQGEPESVQGAFVSSNFFPAMGVAPTLGRVFTDEEESRRERVVLLSDGLWTRRFGKSRDVLGEMLQIDGADYQIIGVMPATFQFPAPDQQFWAPLTTNRYWGDAALAKNDPVRSRYFYERWQAVGRLRPDASLSKAQAEITTIFSRLTQADRDPNRGSGITVTPLRVRFSGNTRLGLLVLSGAVFLVLLIACSNVASLVLARSSSRERESAVRTALGAGRGRLARQLLTESAVLALLAGLAGLLLASGGVRVLIALAPPGIPRIEQAGVDRGVLAFTLSISLLAAFVSGFAPALRVLRKDPIVWLRPGDRSGKQAHTRTRSALVVAEFALAVVLLAGTGLLLRSFLALRAVDPGFRPESVLTMNIALPPGSPESASAFYDAILERVQDLPGTKAVAEVDSLFELANVSNLGLRAIEGKVAEPKDQWTPLSWVSIRGDYFRAMGTPLLRGRYFGPQDVSHSALVAIVDESMARRYWPGEDPIGKRFKGQDRRGQNDDWITVVGLVRDMRRSGVENSPFPHVFEPAAQGVDVARTPYLVVRTSGDTRMIAGELRSTVRGLSDIAILSSVTTLERELDEQLSPRRFQTWLFGIFSVIALLLAALGIFGLMHYSVAQRTPEIGIRAALGARPEDVLQLILAEAAKLALLGIAIGIGGALVLTRFIASLLFAVRPADPLTFAGVPILLASVALLASFIPARRAMRIDPMVALRYE